MLISLTNLFKKYSMKVTGVIHVGAHYAEEYFEYSELGIKPIHFIEPASKAFGLIRDRFDGNPNVSCYNVACGASFGKVELFTETKNKGQSNSILKPKKHIDHYPDIVFNGSEQVELVTLDSLNITGCNFINIDVQGFELEVFKGATETLKGIDYIYTEVNTDELYEGCARLDQLDAYLKDFVRVETSMTKQGWGDCLMIRK